MSCARPARLHTRSLRPTEHCRPVPTTHAAATDSPLDSSRA